MRNLKSVLVAIMVLCLMMCLAVPAFATEATDTTEASTDSATTTEATTGDTAAEDETADTTATGDTASGETTDEHDHEEESTETTGDAAPAETKTSVWKTVLLVLEVIASVALIIVVLLQSGKESGLGNAISGNSDSYMSKNKNGGLDKALASATKWVALVWILVTLGLGLVK